MTDKPTKSDWDKLAAKESRGKDLTRETVEGIRLQTVYGPEDAEGIAVAGREDGRHVSRSGLPPVSSAALRHAFSPRRPHRHSPDVGRVF